MLRDVVGNRIDIATSAYLKAHLPLAPVLWNKQQEAGRSQFGGVVGQIVRLCGPGMRNNLASVGK